MAKKKTKKVKEDSFGSDPVIKSIEAQRKYNQDQLKSAKASIRAKSEAQKAVQRDVNKRTEAGVQVMGLRSGRERYAAEIQGGIMAATEAAGLEKLRGIDNDEMSLIADAEAAGAENDFKLLNEKITLIESKREEKRKLVQEQLKLQEEEDKKAKEAERQQTRERAIVGLMKQGVNDPLDIFDYVNYDDSGKLIGDISLDEVVGVIENVQKTDKTTGDLRQFLDSKRQGIIPQDMQFFDYKTALADAGQSTLDVATKRASLAKTYKEIEAIGAESGTKAFKEALALQKEFGDAYLKRPEVQRLTVSQDAYQTAKAAVGGKDLSKITLEQATNLSEAAATTLAKQLARLQNPDTARAADDGSITDANSIEEITSQFKNTLIKGNKVIPSKVVDASKQIDAIYKTRVKAVEPINAEFKTLRTQFGSDVRLPGEGLETQMVTISGKSVPVGSTITTKSGKKAVVNANGTVTPI